MAALRRRGVKVGSAKVGPDYIDPGYHRLATGLPPRNLDSFLSPEPLIPALAARASNRCDVLVVEGVMGLFDGASSPLETSATGLPAASTAAIAALTSSPVVLVVDASSMSQSVAALVHGFVSWSLAIAVSGVILNRVGSDAHEEGLRQALTSIGVPVLGALRRDPALAWRDRHLGLVPVAERPGEIGAALALLADAVDRDVDLDAVMLLARSAPACRVTTPLPEFVAPRRAVRPRIAVAGGPAFTFVYQDNLERFEEAGAELVPLDPLADRQLPDGVDALYAGGGFPEVYAPALAANSPLLVEVAGAAARGLPIWAECGGLLWLARSLDGHRLCGVLPSDGQMTERLTLGYRVAQTRTASPIAPSGTTLRGHEFHYSSLDPPGDASMLSNHRERRAEGFATPSLFASYLHLHLGGDVGVAGRFVAAAAGELPRDGGPDGSAEEGRGREHVG
jgi:cobyrinic acid a,c-diamide synthase